jgi:cell division protein FtsB
MRTPLPIFIVVCALVGATAVAMALDPRGFRAWRHLGSDVRAAEAQNAALAAQIDVLRRKVDALRSGPQALERAAHENGYVHENEMLFELK